MPPLSGTHLQVRRVDGFWRMIAQTTRTGWRKDVPFWILLTVLPISGVKSPQTPFWGRE